MMSGSSSWSAGSVTGVMVAVELLEQGLNTLSKAVITHGMSSFVLVFYSYSLSIFILLPASMIFYWRRQLPKITPSIVFRLYLLGVIGCLCQLLTYIGIGYSSPTLSSAMTDLTPAFTFILALMSRMEKLDLRVLSSLAKFIGTLVSITGALTMTLVKGLPLIDNVSSLATRYNLLLPQSSWIVGAVFLASAAFLLSLLYVVKTWIIRDYPAELLVVLGSSLSTAVNSGLVALILERDPNAWRLKPGMELITIGYSAVFIVVIRNVTHAWGCRVNGPVYVSMFKPLGMVFAIVLGVFFLKDTLYLGSVIGAVVIAVGFYSVIWGKAQEEKIDAESQIRECNRTPLLSTKVEM